MTDEENIRVAVSFITALGENDLEGAIEQMAPDGLLIAKGRSRFAGEHTREMIASAVQAMQQIVPRGLNFSIGTVTASDNRVVIEAQSRADIGDEELFCNDYAFVVELEAGKIKRCSEYFCTNYADQKLWPVAERAGYGFE